MYTTIQDLQSRLALEVLLYLVDDERAGELTPDAEQRITTALEQAESEADAYIGQRYPVPLPTVPLVVQSRVLDIAVYRLFMRRGIRVGTADEVVLQAYRDAVRFFEHVAVGKASLPIPTTPTSTGTIRPNGGAKITAPDRLFSRESLEDF